MPSTYLSTGLAKALRLIANLGNSRPMNGQGIDQAIARIEAALARINSAAELLPANSDTSAGDSSMRQELASTLKQLDALIESLEG